MRFLPVCDPSGVGVISTEDIDIITILDGVVTAKNSEKEYSLKYFRSLGDLEKRLDRGTFFRANRSTLVRIDRITMIFSYSKSTQYLITSSGLKIKIS